jgi:TonB family protein
MRIASLLVLISSVFIAGCATGRFEATNNFEKGNYSAAVTGLQALAEQGNVEAETDLGYLYQYGLSVQKDEGKALELFQKSAAQGYAPSETCLGVLLMKGTSVDRDFSKAMSLFQSAAAKGYVHASENIALMYDSGDGVARNPTLAKKWASPEVWRNDEDWHHYAAGLLRAIDNNKHYPRSAVNRLAIGVTRVGFTVYDGLAREIWVVHSSGWPDLDDAAVAATKATKFPPPPLGMLIESDFKYEFDLNFGLSP